MAEDKKPQGSKRGPFYKERPEIVRFAPVLECMKKSNISVAELAERSGLTRQCINQRINIDDCTLSFMERIADAAGYEFVWSWKKKRGGKAAKEEAPAAE